ncbi:Uncharacterised protein [Chlamydia trachomatis]|nr:Uncharacterised protein [Chlamydia trachomatis]
MLLQGEQLAEITTHGSAILCPSATAKLAVPCGARSAESVLHSMRKRFGQEVPALPAHTMAAIMGQKGVTALRCVRSINSLKQARRPSIPAASQAGKTLKSKARIKIGEISILIMDFQQIQASKILNVLSIFLAQKQTSVLRGIM